MEHRWCADTLSQVQATPWSLHEKPEPEVRFREAAPAEASGDVQVAPRQALRRLKINKADLDKYGYSVDCQQCRHVELYGKYKSGIPHSETCRARIIEAMKQDDVGKQRLAEYDQRIDREIAERIEEADKGRDRQPAPERQGKQAARNELGVPQEHRPEPRRERVRIEAPDSAPRHVHGGAEGSGGAARSSC